MTYILISYEFYGQHVPIIIISYLLKKHYQLIEKHTINVLILLSIE